jgi:hypothetical protein
MAIKQPETSTLRIDLPQKCGFFQFMGKIESNFLALCDECDCTHSETINSINPQAMELGIRSRRVVDVVQHFVAYICGVKHLLFIAVAIAHIWIRRAGASGRFGSRGPD